MSSEEFAVGIVSGAVTGGIANGTVAVINGRNFWTGHRISIGAVGGIGGETAAVQSETSTTQQSASNQQSTNNQSTSTQQGTSAQQKTKPMQRHHFATNKNQKFTPKMERIALDYGLSLDGEWNIELLPHQGRHPDFYHRWVLEEMRGINSISNLSQSEFIRQFEIRVIEPVRQNPNMLYKRYWMELYFGL